MFEEYQLTDSVLELRERYAPETLVFSCERDFETLPPAQAEALGLFVDALQPTEYSDSWIPNSAPSHLSRYASSEFTIGMPGDGSIAWTHQTDPAVVLVKPRLRGSPESFVEFLLAEAFVEIGLDVPEHFLPFFEDRYPELSSAIPENAVAAYQIAAALFDGWVGLQSRKAFTSWDGDESPSVRSIADAWNDAGTRLEPRIDSLPGEVARGELDVSDATELACAAIKHDLELPAPYAALNTSAYREHGSNFAIRWAEKTFEAIT